MKGILFKAKRLDNGEWVHGNLLKTKYKEIVHICQEYSIWMCDGETVCQYTGLTDKNGVKIFEGDRCVFHGEEDSDPYKVFWDAEDFRWSVKDETCGVTDSLDWFFAERCTVSGNIHDDV